MKKILMVVAISIVIYQLTNCSDNDIDVNQLSNSDVVLYATEWCGYCKKTRQYFAKNDIPYVEYDIEKSAEGKRQFDELSDSGGVPLVVIKGHVIQGYSEKQISWALKNL